MRKGNTIATLSLLIQNTNYVMNSKMQIKDTENGKLSNVFVQNFISEMNNAVKIRNSCFGYLHFSCKH